MRLSAASPVMRRHLIEFVHSPKIAKTMRLLNSEWFRHPFSPLEKTLRGPFLARSALVIFLIRIIPVWVALGLVIGLIAGKFLLALALGFSVTLARELFTLRQWYEESVLPRHRKQLSIIRKTDDRKSQTTTPNLVNHVEMAARQSAWSIINIGYLGVAAWGWEIIFRAIYPLLVTHDKIPYQNVLIGFNNKTTEADQRLWEIAQVKNRTQKNQLLSTYLDAYGSRTEDLDLAYPTLRERPKTIASLLILYQKTPSPQSLVKKAQQKREESLKQVLSALRIPQPVFLELLNLVQANVVVREDRRFYEFEADYYIRSLLFELATRVCIPKEKLFTMTWRQIKHTAYRQSR